MNDLIIRQATTIDLESCVAVETGCFQPSEAAPRESIAERIELFPDGFLVAEQKGSIIGMINSGSDRQARHYRRGIEKNDRPRPERQKHGGLFPGRSAGFPGTGPFQKN